MNLKPGLVPSLPAPAEDPGSASFHLRDGVTQGKALLPALLATGAPFVETFATLRKTFPSLTWADAQPAWVGYARGITDGKTLKADLEALAKLHPAYAAWALETFPTDRTLKGDLSFWMEPWVVWLPEGLAVEGRLSVNWCASLLRLPKVLRAGDGDKLDLMGNHWTDTGHSVATNADYADLMRDREPVTAMAAQVAEAGGAFLALRATGMAPVMALAELAQTFSAQVMAQVAEPWLRDENALDRHRPSGGVGHLLRDLAQVAGAEVAQAALDRLIWLEVPQSFEIPTERNKAYKGGVGERGLDRWLVRLPAGLRIRGSLDLDGHLGLWALPEDLRAGMGVRLRDCDSLTRAPGGMRFGKDGAVQVEDPGGWPCEPFLKSFLESPYPEGMLRFSQEDAPAGLALMTRIAAKALRELQK
jgi:hypothetical protein